MAKTVESLSRGEMPSTVESPEGKLEKNRLKLEAQIFAIKYKDEQEKINTFFPKENTSGKECERKIIVCLKEIGILPVIESAPPSLDKPDGCSKADIILMLPSGRVLATQIYSAPSHYDKEGIHKLGEKVVPTILHGIKKLQRRGRQSGRWYSQEVLCDFPMPIGVAAVDENLVLDSTNPAVVAREFLRNLAVGISPDTRKRFVQSLEESYSPRHDQELGQFQQELSALAQSAEPIKFE